LQNASRHFWKNTPSNELVQNDVDLAPGGLRQASIAPIEAKIDFLLAKNRLLYKNTAIGF